MRLLIKQRVFSWSDTYDVYDENGNAKYFVRNEIFSLFHRIHVEDINGNEIGMITQAFSWMLPRFEISIYGRYYGIIEQKFSFFHPEYEIDYKGWRCEGDFLAWNYDVYSACSSVVHISRQWLSWGDTYIVDIANPSDEIPALMLVIAIDAANCSRGD